MSANLPKTATTLKSRSKTGLKGESYAGKRNIETRRTGQARRQSPIHASGRICPGGVTSHSRGQAWRSLRQTSDCHWSVKGAAGWREASASAQGHRFGGNAQERRKCLRGWPESATERNIAGPLPRKIPRVATGRPPGRIARGLVSTSSPKLSPKIERPAEGLGTESSSDTRRTPSQLVGAHPP